MRQNCSAYGFHRRFMRCCLQRLKSSMNRHDKIWYHKYMHYQKHNVHTQKSCLWVYFHWPYPTQPAGNPTHGWLSIYNIIHVHVWNRLLRFYMTCLRRTHGSSPPPKKLLPLLFLFWVIEVLVSLHWGALYISPALFFSRFLLLLLFRCIINFSWHIKLC